MTYQIASNKSFVAFVLTVVFFLPETAKPAECPQYALADGQSARGLQIPSGCVASSFTCSTGRPITVAGPLPERPGFVSVTVRCQAAAAPVATRPLTPPPPPEALRDTDVRDFGASEFSKSIRGQSNRAPAADPDSLRALALSQGVPSVVFDRANANHQELLRDGKTKRPCFMAADLTTQDQGRLWLICSDPQKVVALPTFFGSGEGARCHSTPFKNNKGCAKFFGNKDRYCLPTGGRYLTSTASRALGSQRPLIELMGLDGTDNNNASMRRVGIHQAILHNGRPYGKELGAETSQGCFTLPKDLPDFRIGDLSSSAEGGGMAFYVYPSRQDIKELVEGRSAYWDATCLAKIGKPGWLGRKESHFDPASAQAESDEFLRDLAPTNDGDEGENMTNGSEGAQ